MADYSFYIITTYALSGTALVGLAVFSYRKIKSTEREAQKLRKMRKERG